MVGSSSESIVYNREELQELALEAQREPEARETPAVEWVMSLTRRSSLSISLASGISWSSRTESSIATGSSLEASRRNEKLISPSPISVLVKESLKSRPGWPLLLIKMPGTMDSSTESGVSSVCSSENSEPATPKFKTDLIFKQAQEGASEEAPEMMHKGVDLVLELDSSTGKLFTYEMLDEATNHFSSENLIGEGGCSVVYRGFLPSGKPVAVKVLKQYKEAWSDFSLEVEIVASLDHQYITPLVGACSEQNRLMLVYDFLSEGSLEERLEDHRNNQTPLPWKARFEVALAVAEALNYLHNKCPRPVIHRDVKSSNILLSSQFQPQLSDFGLAIWGPPQTTYATRSDVVGTFGYIAPEYFMLGRVSEKTDVYSYGVVLLELLTGRKAISSKGQESLVKWAMPFLEKGDLKSLLDPKLTGKVNIAEIQRTILAAVLCTKQSPRLRPNAGQILRLLRGEDARCWVNAYVNDLIASDKLDDNPPDIYQCQAKPHPDLSILDLDDKSFSPPQIGLAKTSEKMGHNRRLKLKDYLEEALD